MLAEPLVTLEDNSKLASLLLQLQRVTGDSGYRERALTLLRTLAPESSRMLVKTPTPSAPQQVAVREGAADLALALELASAPYALLTIVGPHDDPRTQQLLAGARDYYNPTRLIRHDAPGEGHYPYPGEPVLYLCNEDACSLPVRSAERVQSAARAFMASVR